MTAPHDALTLSVNFNDGTGVVALQMTYTWVGPGFGESLPAPVATLTAPPGITLWRINYATSEAAPADAYGGQFYLRQGTGDPAAPTWGPWILWVEEPASAWAGGFSSMLTVPAALTPPDTLLAVDPPLRDQYQSLCVDCVDSGPLLVSRSGGTPSWARYLVAYAWLNADGDQTRAQTVALDSASMHGGVAASTSAWQPREKHFNIIPAGATAVRWYVKPPIDTSDPASGLGGWLRAADVPVVAGTVADWTLTVADAGTWPAAALPALNATCRAGWLRLSHASGRSYVQQDGEQVQVRAGDADVLHLPLATLGAAPAMLVGKDPATGLPAFCPPPNVVEITPAPNAPQTPPAVPPNDFRCGIAQYVGGQMVIAYNVAAAKVVSLNTTENTLVALGGPLAAAILGLLDVVFPPLLIVTAFAIPFIVLLANYQESAALLPLGGPALDAIARSLYCALRADSAGQFPIDGTTLFNWSYNLTNFGSSFSGNQMAEVRLLITVYQQEYWHNLAIQAGQEGSTLCAGYDCTGLLP